VSCTAKRGNLRGLDRRLGCSDGPSEGSSIRADWVSGGGVARAVAYGWNAGLCTSLCRRLVVGEQSSSRPATACRVRFRMDVVRPSVCGVESDAAVTLQLGLQCRTTLPSCGACGTTSVSPCPACCSACDCSTNTVSSCEDWLRSVVASALLSIAVCCCASSGTGVPSFSEETPSQYPTGRVALRFGRAAT
jgi:hypothetical protein